jgi:internalin A
MIKRFVSVIIMTLLLAVIMPVQTVSAGTLDDIPDENLRALFREVLSQPYGSVNLVELGTIVRLNGANRNIVDITGLEFCTNMNYVDLSNNQITDLNPLSKMYSVALGTTLRDVNLKNNLITDVTPLVEITQLDTLNLAGNLIADLSPFYAEGRVYNLTLLNLTGNQITDLTALSGMTSIKYLFLDNNRITDIAPLVANSGINASDMVNLSGNPLDEVSVAEHIPALEARWVKVMWSPPLPPASAVAAVVTAEPEIMVSFSDANLETLLRGLTGKDSGDVYQSDLERLTAINAGGLRIASLDGLEYCTNLRTLSLVGSSSEDIDLLEDDIALLEQRGVSVILGESEITGQEADPTPAPTSPAATDDVSATSLLIYIISGLAGGAVLGGLGGFFLLRRRTQAPGG